MTLSQPERNRLIPALTVIAFSALWLGPAMLLATPAGAAEIAAEIWSISRGGQLYDNWAASLDTEAPEVTHPAYPAAGRQKGRVTWRCKECHGWDGKGEDGVYGKGPHFTGVKGVRRVIGWKLEQIIGIVRDKTHGYTPEMIPPIAATKIAQFLSVGQIDMDQYIKRRSKQVLGSIDRGAAFYQSICRICHGYDGRRLNFEHESAALAAFGDPAYLGTLANKDPWQVLHKIRNGQPGVGMVALRVLSIQDQVDVLAYLQTLPLKPLPQK